MPSGARGVVPGEMAGSHGQRLKQRVPEQGLAADVSCAFDRITVDEPESALSDRQIDLTEGFISQVGLIPTDIRVIGDFLRGRQIFRGRSVTSND